MKPAILASIIASVLLCVAVALLVVYGGVIAVAIPIGILSAVVCALIIKYQPTALIYFIIFAGFLINGLTRYVPAPLGLAIDGLLVAGIIISLIAGFGKHLVANTGVATILSFIWLIYTILELFNPEALSAQAWFYAVRGVSFYFFGTLVLAQLLLPDYSKLKPILLIWIVLGLIGAFWGIKQKFIGLDRWESYWLNTVGRITHLLRGNLRHFSFFSDAGQFGAAMGHLVVLCGILALGPYQSWKRVASAIIALICFYGLIISGTRGAFFVIVGGAFGFILISKNIRLTILSSIMAFAAFAFLKFTYIGQGVYEIRRLRTALDPNDASLQVRLDNQKLLAEYLGSRPFGAGIGSGGGWGQRFSPGSYLSTIEYDSWYVKIWAETGVVGLSFHILSLLTFLIVGFIYIWKEKNKVLQNQLTALWCGLLGIIIASYGNQIFGQAPTSVLVYLSIHFLCNLKPTNQQYVHAPLAQ